MIKENVCQIPDREDVDFRFILTSLHNLGLLLCDYGVLYVIGYNIEVALNAT